MPTRRHPPIHLAAVVSLGLAAAGSARATAPSTKQPAAPEHVRPTGPGVWRFEEIADEEIVGPGEHRRRVYLGHAEALSAAVVFVEQVPIHCHPKHDEILQVLEGRGRFRVGRDVHDIETGDMLLVPRDVLHGVVEGMFTFLLVTSPAEGELEPDTAWATGAPLTYERCAEYHGDAKPTRKVLLASANARAEEQLERVPEVTPTEPEARPQGGIPLKVGAEFVATLSGFIEFDAIVDSHREGFTESMGNASFDPEARPRPSLALSPRNTRFQLKLAAPRTAGDLRLSSVLEIDLLGATPAGLLRLRHAFVRAEKRPFYVLAGQTWSPLGWQPYYHPLQLNTPGLVGELFGRRPQLRGGLLFTPQGHEIDLALAVLQPAQRGATRPDASAGLRWAHRGWRGGRTYGSFATGLAPLSLGVSGLYRRFELPGEDVDGWAVAADLFVPLVPGRAGSLGLVAEAQWGRGTADQLTGLTGGLGTESIMPNTGLDPGLVYKPDASARAVPIEWRSAAASLELYLPGGEVVAALGAGAVQSPSLEGLSAPGPLFHTMLRGTGSLLYIFSDWGRVGVEYNVFRQRLVGGGELDRSRAQATMLFIY